MSLEAMRPETKRGRVAFWLGWLLVVVPTGVAMYLFQPFPGSQELNSLRFAWHLERVRPWTEIGGALLLLAGLVWTLRSAARTWKKVGAVIGVALAAVVLWLAHIKMAPAAWFLPPQTVRFERGTSSALPPSTLVMGVAANGEAKAYPLRLLAYHHRVEDRLGGEPIWVTYCTMCRTGKVFRPVVNGRPLRFDLVGAYRYNSVYSDRETGSWWYQANGSAAVGPLAGAVLPELLSDQMTLGEWLALHPESQVFQPDPAFDAGYHRFSFDTFDSKREDPARGPRWQWVVGVRQGSAARSYPWSILARQGVIEDRLGDLPLAVALHPDGISYRVWDRRLDGRELRLRRDGADGALVDDGSGTRFGFDGVGHGGALEGRTLRQLQGSLEYLHSFEGFSGGALYSAPVAAAAPAGAAISSL